MIKIRSLAINFLALGMALAIDLQTLRIKLITFLNLTALIMNKLEITGNWNFVKEKLKERFAMLTGNDLLYFKGKKKN